MTAALVVVIAVLIDVAFGEPPSRAHPVVWIGNWFHFARARWRASTPTTQFLEGALWWIAGAVLVTGTAWLAANWLTRLPIPVWLEGLLLALLLKPLIALRSLFAAVRAVRRPLEQGDVPEARKLLSWHLVSRDTTALCEDEVAGAAIESLFENLSDSLIAPLLCFLIGGLPLAALYRYANTGDAMWGYRTSALEYAGKFAARMDDLLNLIPSRITGACIALASLRLGAWRAMLRDGLRTASPNAGVPMAAGAGALGIRLEKRGVYALNPAARPPETADLTRALRLAGWAFGVFVTLIVALGGLL